MDGGGFLEIVSWKYYMLKRMRAERFNGSLQQHAIP